MEMESSNSGAEWLRGEGNAADVVISSRVRLARNILGHHFLAKADQAERVHILEIARRHLLECALVPKIMWVDLTELPVLERHLLMERHLISKQHAKGREPRGVAISAPDERLSIMVNEEDHLRIQVLRSALSLSDAFEHANMVDDKIGAGLEYAYSPRFGYLTACPTNVGTGVRVSVMLHLPGLKMTGEVEKVQRAARGMSLAVRGYYGEGSEAVGDFYQLSNQTTLGKSEADILAAFEQRIIPKVIEYERLARRQLLESRRVFLEDRVYRALGTLTNARLLKAAEALELLSHVRLGIITGMLQDISIPTVHQLILSTQPAHLQKMAGKPLDQATRRIRRAEIVREAFAR